MHMHKSETMEENGIVKMENKKRQSARGRSAF